MVVRSFSRLQTGSRTEKKVKEGESSKKEAQADDKFIKLSKKEDTSAKATKELADRRAKADGYKVHDITYDDKIIKKTKILYKEKLEANKIDPVENPLQTHDLLREALRETVSDRVQHYQAQEEALRKVFNELDIRNYDGKTWKQIQQQKPHFNSETFVNEKFHIEPVLNPGPMSRRTGALGYKVGMVSEFDKWGHLIPLTVLQIDRCQVVRVKTKAEEGYDALVVGSGEKSMNTVTKPMVGQFLKAGIPPKLDVAEFRISPENALPVGFMIGARHFTVGQFVDIKAKSKGKGFAGVMKRWNFDGQPASHGCSVSHRAPGSTGQRQDPGRVFKGKKMAGHLGYENITVRKLQIYKIDYDRSLIYVKGTVPGAINRLTYIFDSFFNWKDNLGKLNYPTFIYQKGKVYANLMQLEPPQQDPTEDWLHENAILSDDEEEGAGVTTS